MKIETTREDLLVPLQKVTGVVERRQTLPILSNTLIKIGGGTISFTGTDLEVQLVTQSPLHTDASGETTVPARKFLDIIRLLPEQAPVTISVEGDKFRIRSRSSRFVLNTLDAGNYPVLDDTVYASEFMIESRTLKYAFEKTIFCMAQQDVRYYLNGAMLDVDSRNLRLVASDGHRLALYTNQLEPDASRGAQQIILPRKGVLELYRLLDDTERPVRVQFSRNQIRVTMDGVTFSSKLIDGKYPDFSKVLAQEHGAPIVTADRAELRNALSRVSILSNEKHRGIAVKIDGGSMSLNSYNAEHDEAEEDVLVVNPAEVTASVGFNVQYLIDAVSNVDGDEVHMAFAENSNSCFIKDPANAHSIFLVMPMRL